MGSEIIGRALELAKADMFDEAIELVRPLLTSGESSTDALLIMAYCGERKGHVAAARYLYAEAARRNPISGNWLDHLERCEKAYQKGIDEAQGRKPNKKPLALSMCLLPLSVLLLYAAVPGLLPELLMDLFDVPTAGITAYLIAISSLLGLVGLWLVAGYLQERIAIAKKLKRAMGENYSDDRHIECRSCHLRPQRALGNCSFCGQSLSPPAQQTVQPQQGGSAKGDEVSSGTSSLVKCPDCGQDVSRRATACPKCGAPVSTSDEAGVSDVWVWWLVFAPLLVGVVGVYMGSELPWFAYLLTNILFCELDFRVLRKRGYEAPIRWWFFLVPAYLIRARQETQSLIRTVLGMDDCVFPLHWNSNPRTERGPGWICPESIGAIYSGNGGRDSERTDGTRSEDGVHGGVYQGDRAEKDGNRVHWSRGVL